MHNYMRIILLTLLFIFTCSIGFSQKNFKKKKPYAWMIGIQWNIMDDDGYRTEHIINYKDSWNLPVFPSSINLDIYLKKGMSLDFLATKYAEWKCRRRIQYYDCWRTRCSMENHRKNRVITRGI